MYFVKKFKGSKKATCYWSKKIRILKIIRISKCLYVLIRTQNYSMKSITKFKRIVQL